jgi:hypothetical protein
MDNNSALQAGLRFDNRKIATTEKWNSGRRRLL